LAGEASKPSLFTRNATGLIRELSAFAVFAWAIVYFPWLSSWAGIFWVTPEYYVNVNYYASLGVWAIIAVVIVLLYWQMTAIMPRSGGDYVFVSRTINPLVGFIAGFLFFIAIIVSAGSGPFWAFAESGSQLWFAGNVLHNSFMANLGSSITPFGATPNFNLMFGLGLIILAAGATVTLIGGRLLRSVIYAFFAYAFITLVVVVAIFLTTSHAQFVSDYNVNAAAFTNSTSNIFTQAKQLGYTPGASLANLSAVIPLLFVSIGPYPVLQMVGGEIKNPRRSLLYGLVGAEILSIGVWFALTFLLDHVISISFIEAWTKAPSGGGGFPPVPTIFVGAIAPNALLAWFIFGGLFVSNLGWSWLGFTFLSRLVMSWSFDRVVPESFSYVSPRFRTPIRAAALICAIAIIPMYLEFYTTFLGTQVNSIFLLALVWILTSIAAIVLPFRKKDIYKGWGGQIGGVPTISMLGAIGLVVFGYLAYNSVTNPAIGPFEVGAQEFIIAIFAAAIVIYLASYFYHKSRNLNLNAVFNELPPE
jgi:basic amino acid/polyamine antiporter, APA family